MFSKRVQFVYQQLVLLNVQQGNRYYKSLLFDHQLSETIVLKYKLFLWNQERHANEVGHEDGGEGGAFNHAMIKDEGSDNSVMIRFNNRVQNSS